MDAIRTPSLQLWAKSVIVVLCLAMVGCKRDERRLLKSDPKVYILADDGWGRSCSPSRLEKNVLYPSMCRLIVENFETFKHRDRILETSESEWITLLQSDSTHLHLSKSASVWLYFLSKEEMDLVEYCFLYNNWGQKDQKKQVKFWKSYFAEHEGWPPLDLGE